MLKSMPTDPLEKCAFDFKKNGTVRKNASVKSCKMVKSSQLYRISNSILDYIINQSQKIIALQKSANHPALRSIIKSAGLHHPMEYKAVVYHEK